MCGCYALTASRAGIETLFKMILPLDLNIQPRYNIAPTQDVLVVRSGARPGDREAALVRWGLIPRWARDPSVSSHMINARAETAAEKPAYRWSFQFRRCLLPADGFYEWKTEGKHKQPYFIRMVSGEPFALAGLWERWQGPDAAIDSCTILTTEPNDLVRPIHNRMPVIIAPANYALWLDRTVTEPGPLAPLLRPYETDAMVANPVSLTVNDQKASPPDLTLPL